MLTDLYPPYIGGIEQHVRNLAHNLTTRGHDVVIAMLADGDTLVEEDSRVRVHRLRSTAQRAASISAPSGRPFAAPLPDPEVVLGLRRLIEREAFDVVHAHNWIVRSFLPLKARSGAALVVTSTTMGSSAPRGAIGTATHHAKGPASKSA